jgi:hypothetical protein
VFIVFSLDAGLASKTRDSADLYLAQYWTLIMANLV